MVTPLEVGKLGCSEALSGFCLHPGSLDPEDLDDSYHQLLVRKGNLRGGERPADPESKKPIKGHGWIRIADKVVVGVTG